MLLTWELFDLAAISQKHRIKWLLSRHTNWGAEEYMQQSHPVYPSFKEYKEIKSKEIGWSIFYKLKSGTFVDFQLQHSISG